MENILDFCFPSVLTKDILDKCEPFSCGDNDMDEFDTKSDYLDTLNDTYELAVPTKERSIFNIFIHKMGWTANSRKIAML